MWFRKTVLGLSVAATMTLAAGSAHSEEPSVSPELVQALIERLQNAEKQIQSLKLELKDVRVHQAANTAPSASGSIGSSVGARDIPAQDALLEEVPDGESIYTIADGDTLADRLKSLETKVDGLSDSQNEMSDTLSGEKKRWRINGRIHLDNWSFADSSDGISFFENPGSGDDPENRTFFRRIRLKMDGDITDNMLYRMQIDFNSPDSGEMKDMYIGFKDLAGLGTLLVGNQKRPLGLDHLNSSRFNGRLSSSPWYDECSDGRGYFHWAVAGMVARPDGDNHPDETNNNDGRFRTRSELRSGRRWLDTGRIAGSEWYETVGLESVFNVGPLQVTGEYQFNWMQRDNTAGPDLYFHGAYIYAAYMLTGEHVPYSRKSGTIGRVKPFENFFLIDRCCGRTSTGWGAWQVALRYSYLDLTDGDIQGGVENNVTLGLVWYLNSHASMQFNAIYGDIRNHAPAGGFSDGHFTALGTRLRINF